MQIFISLSRHLLSVEEFAALVWTLSAFALVTTLLRLFIRIFVSKAFGLDDGLIIAGQLSAIVVSAFSHWSAAGFWKVYAYSESTDVFSFASFNVLAEADIFVRSGILLEIVYLVTLALVKCSILAFYRRIVAQDKHRRFLYILASVIIIQSLVNMLMIIFWSDPQFAWWNQATKLAGQLANEDRLSRDHLNLANSAFQVLFDVIILALPIPIIIKTKFKKRDRVGLIIIYALSFLSLAATIVRLYMADQYNRAENLLDGGVTRLDYFCWTVVEIATGIICANLPATSSLVRHCSRSRIKATRAYKVTSNFSNKWTVLQGHVFSIIRSDRKSKNTNSDSLSQSDMLEKGSNETSGSSKGFFHSSRKGCVDGSNNNTSSSMTSYYASENSDIYQNGYSSNDKNKNKNKKNKKKKKQNQASRTIKSVKHIPITISSNAGSSTMTATTFSGAAAAVPAKNETSWFEPKTEIHDDDDDDDDGYDVDRLRR